MAWSVVGSASNPADNGSLSAASVAVTPPGGMASGDLVVLIVQIRTTTGSLAMSETSGQTWTEHGQSALGNNQQHEIFTCTFNGTWGADPSVIWSSSPSTIIISAVMHVFRGGDDTVDVAFASATFAAPSTPFDVSRAGVTTVANGALVIATFGANDDNTWAVQTAGWANPGAAQYRNTAGTDQSLSTAWLEQVSAGPTGAVVNRQATLGGDAGVASIIAFKPTVASGDDPLPLDRGHRPQHQVIMAR